eukprot:TRINITY_DN14894_c0_g1_i4.p1 TRINITY_DN14894_c0_g1~~TRINITY_DN14894_c0_g1_i4.p1  ORF type:complete len:318 (+),score=50.34 TRINITY_DN14894_c0_g1_i4:133-1086(+)
MLSLDKAAMSALSSSFHSSAQSGQTRMRTCRIPQDESGDSDADQVSSAVTANPGKNLEFEVRVIGCIALAALIVAGACVCVLVLALLPSSNGVQPVSLPNIQNEAVSLEELSIQPGRACSLVNAVVRKSKETDSERVAVIPLSQPVLISELVGRRAHIIDPIDGWVSVISRDGIQILQNRDSCEAFIRDGDASRKHRPLPNQTVEEALAQLRDQVLKFQGLQKHVLKAVDYANQKMASKHLVHKVADQASDHASKALERIKGTVENLHLERFDAEAFAKNLLDGKVQLPGGTTPVDSSEARNEAASLADQTLRDIAE